MTTNRQYETPDNGDSPEAGATDEAIALHGDQARAEQHEQPQAVTLDGGTRIATGPADEDAPKR